jgi:hypothetical protein
MAIEVKRTDHAGPKNGGGYWGNRSEAKAGSKKRRRSIPKRLVLESQQTSDESKNEPDNQRDA